MWGGGKAQEGPVLAQDEFFALGKGIVFLPQRVDGEPCSVVFVGCKRGDVVDAVSQRG